MTKRDTRGRADTNTHIYHRHFDILTMVATFRYIQYVVENCQISERTYGSSLIEGQLPGAAPNCEKSHAATTSSGAKEAETKKTPKASKLVDEPRHCRIYVGIVPREWLSWCDSAA